MYEGTEIKTVQDLLDNFHLDTFDVSLVKNKAEAEADSLSPSKIDDIFAHLIHSERPGGQYYEHSLGDKLLYLKRVDKIKYDLVAAEKIRKQEALDKELAAMREEQLALKHS